MRQVKFNDLHQHHANHRQDFHSFLDQLLDSSAYIGGSALSDFESAFAQYCQSKYAIGVGNGTDALYLALRAIGINKGDYVITVPNTFIATTEAITSAGAKILFVDIDPIERNMDLGQLERLLQDHPHRNKIKCIVPVHLYGQPADMIGLKNIATNYQIPIIADAAQAHGAKIDNQSVTQFADISTFSFYPGKNLGALGDGGAIVTDSEVYADYISRCSNHGRDKKYTHLFEGVNSRLDALQALFLNKKLSVLDEKTQLRQKYAKQYNTLLDGVNNITLPAWINNRLSVFHLYVIEVENRESVASKLNEVGIQTGIHYPISLHLQPAYKYLDLQEGSFPNAESSAKKILTLPLYPEMHEEDVLYVADQLKTILQNL